jgi:hypothetical protein
VNQTAFARRFSLVLASSLLGCSEPAGPQRDSSPIQTDATVYHLADKGDYYDGWAIATYVNRTSAPVYFARCLPSDSTPIYWLRRIGPNPATKTFLGFAWACVGSVPTGTLPVGDSLRVRVWLGSADSPNANPPITPDERSGTFRIDFALCLVFRADSDDCEPVPRTQRQSNAFEVQLP